MIAHKQLSDSPFSNESWSVVGRPLKALTLSQSNMMESEMLQFLGWEVLITPEDLLDVEVSSIYRWKGAVDERSPLC